MDRGVAPVTVASEPAGADVMWKPMRTPMRRGNRSARRPSRHRGCQPCPCGFASSKPGTRRSRSPRRARSTGSRSRPRAISRRTWCGCQLETCARNMWDWRDCGRSVRSTSTGSRSPIVSSRNSWTRAIPNRALWTEPFEEGGGTRPGGRHGAVVDQTGRPGRQPGRLAATEGHGDDPVTGVRRHGPRDAAFGETSADGLSWFRGGEHRRQSTS